jgi:hypothetical protein
MGIPKIIAMSNRDESNARLPTWQLMSEVMFVVKIILRITREYGL